ncbi:hypothetical protein BX285_4121 [Streptomyces sp. 1114.5]|nr:hypothetical protein BX285_4121 [Streptomyces sp. 1114.5]SOB85849.1 hypothetical protein SAMN06272789_6150 [Streptomyces sp. 1331.2]
MTDSPARPLPVTSAARPAAGQQQPGRPRRRDAARA